MERQLHNTENYKRLQPKTTKNKTARFIDMFFIWIGSQKNLKKFLNELNKKHESIKFDNQISKK